MSEKGHREFGVMGNVTLQKSPVQTYSAFKSLSIP